MQTKNVLLLVLLSAIWGGSFIFMRVLAPVFGAIGTANIRLFVGAVFLLVIFHFTGFKIQWKRDWKFLLVIGVINSAIPFSLFSFAALHIPASISVVINSMTPMFGALFASLILKEKLTLRKTIGLLTGMTGVAIISGSKALPSTAISYFAIAACLFATCCYGLSGALIKKYGQNIEAKAMAGGSQLFASMALFPFLLTTGVTSKVTPNIAMTMIAFGILCSAIAYLIYYYLIKEMGPTPALSVTFLMPVFGILWGVLLLDEALYAQMVVGALVILVGVYLIVAKKKKSLTA
ncbi:MAG TPA: multidrug transporter [Clostridiales bacterium UBA8960]|nr:multidrug transporter [Clostridiales bacterium UBA8960]